MPGSAAKARSTVSLFSTLHGFAGDELSDIETAVGEAVANAIEHGNRQRGAFLVTCSFERGMLTVEVSDGGDGFEDRSRPARDPKEVRSPSSRGYGIYIMRTLMDRVAFEDGGRTVVLEKRCSGSAVSTAGSREASP